MEWVLIFSEDDAKTCSVEVDVIVAY